MDRNMKYRRNCGSNCTTPRGSGSNPARSPENACCLCTSQPVSLAMAYVKDQPFDRLFPLSEAICRGTLFNDLYMPYNAGVRKA